MEFLFLVPEWIIFAAIVFILAVCSGLCFFIGKKQMSKTVDLEQVSGLGTALVGFLAFFLGFALMMAFGRFENRKEILHQEINSIKTAYLTADFLAKPHDRNMKSLLREYTGLRIEYATQITRQEVELNAEKSVALHHQMWDEAFIALEKSTSIHTETFLVCLLDVIKSHERLTTARISHVPEEILWLLLSLSIIVVGTNSYRGGLKGQRFIILRAALIFCVAITLFVIVDLDRPRRGVIRIDLGGLETLYNSMQNVQ